MLGMVAISASIRGVRVSLDKQHVDQCISDMVPLRVFGVARGWHRYRKGLCWKVEGKDSTQELYSSLDTCHSNTIRATEPFHCAHNLKTDLYSKKLIVITMNIKAIIQFFSDSVPNSLNQRNT